MAKNQKNQMLRFRKTALAFALSQILNLGVPAAMAAMIAVDTDSGGANDPNHCTLRDAITAANADAATGGCPAGAGADTIVLPAKATITLTEPDNSDYGLSSNNGLPVVTSVITIEGNGATVHRDSSSPEFRIFSVTSSSLEIRDTTISHGAVYGRGGGISLVDSTVALVNSTVSMNRTHGPYNGGGINAFNGTLNLINSTVSGNSAYFGGGGIMGTNTMITLTNSAISGNDSPSWGSGIRGIGIRGISGSIITLINSTVSGNTGSSGITADESKIILINSTISGNSIPFPFSNYNSGGIQAQKSTQELVLQNSIIANNVGGDCVNNSSITPTGTNNLIGDGGISCGTALLTGDPKLGPLRKNGGSTPTHALLPDSPAIDAGDDTVCDTLPKNARGQSTDQRGRSRAGPRAGSHCDIGAYEFRHRRIE